MKDKEDGIFPLEVWVTEKGNALLSRFLNKAEVLFLENIQDVFVWSP